MTEGTERGDGRGLGRSHGRGRRRGRRAALIAGLGVAVVLAIGAAFWRDFAVLYEVRRLRDEPRRSLEALGKPEGAVARDALRRFASTGEGALALADLYAAEILDQYVLPGAGLAAVDRLSGLDACALGLAGDGRSPEIWFAWRDRKDHVAGAGARRCPDDSPLPGLERLLEASPLRDSGAFTIASYPELEVRVLTGDRAFLVSAAVGTARKGPGSKDLIVLAAKAGTAPDGIRGHPCVLPLLFRTLRSGDEGLRRMAAEALERERIDLDHPAPDLLGLIADDALWSCPHVFDDHPWLWSRSSRGEPRLLHPAAAALIELGPAALPEVLRALDEGPRSEEALRRMMTVFTGSGERGIALLREVVRERGGPVGTLALEALNDAGRRR